ncbi:MAG: amidase [bacterium]|nr:amidase [bacterium]
MQDEWAKVDATGQAEAVASGQVKPVELVEAAIARIERLNPQLNAVIHRHFDRAIEQSRGELPDGPFRGVPFLLKDLGSGARAGDPIHWGTRFLKDAGFCAANTSYLVEKFDAAGLVTVGRTNVPELGAWSITEPDAYGATRNPWNADHASGGSSGGAASATAAGIVPFAHASDGGGSIRNPASQCGLVGLKPSRGRVSLGPDGAEGWAGMVYEFAVTRSVRDCAALLDAVQGGMPGDPYAVASPATPYKSEVGADPGKLRIGIVDRQTDGPLHPDCDAAMKDTGRRLEALGHKVEIAYPENLFTDALLPHVLNVISSSQARDMENMGQAIGRTLDQGDVDSDNWLVSEMGKTISATQYLAAIEAYNLFRREMLAWWSSFDVLVTPTITAPSPLVGEILPDPAKPLDAFMRSGALLGFCVPFNITGQPAMSLPLFQNAKGLPIGVQLIGGTEREDLLIRLAAQLEDDVRWSQRVPAIHA